MLSPHSRGPSTCNEIHTCRAFNGHEDVIWYGPQQGSSESEVCKHVVLKVWFGSMGSRNRRVDYSELNDCGISVFLPAA